MTDGTLLARSFCPAHTPTVRTSSSLRLNQSRHAPSTTGADGVAAFAAAASAAAVASAAAIVMGLLLLAADS